MSIKTSLSRRQWIFASFSIVHVFGRRASVILVVASEFESLAEIFLIRGSPGLLGSSPCGVDTSLDPFSWRLDDLYCLIT
jgi:hypothetical protein